LQMLPAYSTPGVPEIFRMQDELLLHISTATYHK